MTTHIPFYEIPILDDPYTGWDEWPVDSLRLERLARGETIAGFSIGEIAVTPSDFRAAWYRRRKKQLDDRTLLESKKLEWRTPVVKLYKLQWSTPEVTLYNPGKWQGILCEPKYVDEILRRSRSQNPGSYITINGVLYPPQ